MTLDGEGNIISYDIAAQCKAVFENVRFVLEDAGASALELNVYYVAADIDQSGAQVEERYLEILRTLHSFDPCLACSTHVISHDGQELSNVKVR